MKKQYIQPATESVKVNLYNSILEDIIIINDSKHGSDEGLGKEQQFEWDVETTSDLPRDINLWADTDDTEGY